MNKIVVLRSKLNTLRDLASIKHRTMAVSALRICLGIVILSYYAQHIVQREYLWGNSGLIPFTLFQQIMHSQHNLSLYLLSSSHLYSILVFYLGLGVAAAFTLGYKTRISSVLFYVFTWSLFERNPLLLDGGDNLLYLIAFFLMFTDCGAYFSIDAMSARVRDASSPFIAVLHNYAILAIVIQLSIVYFTSAFYKIQGHMWQDGTAIYYILRTSEFNLSPLTRHLYRSAVPITLLTWLTFVFQMSWPFLIWNRRAKPFVVGGAVLLHSMIGYFMGLVWFSLVFISAELVVFDDAELVALAAGLRGFVQSCWTALAHLARGGGRWLGVSPEPARLGKGFLGGIARRVTPRFRDQPLPKL
jgi:hypothetical protein